MPLLAGSPAFELWRAQSEPVTYGQEAGFRIAQAGPLTFALSERPDDADLAQLTRGAYEGLFAALAGQHPYRLHNYVPAILRHEGQTERYRLFNAGRDRAFQARALPVQAAPAACALGAGDGAPLLVYGLAGSEPGLPLENPQQVSAYRYPSDYGPRSPIFARATLGRGPAAGWLFLSGTSAIRGHRTLHAGDVSRQLGLAIDNVAILLEEAREAGARPLADRMRLRIYLKHAEDLGAAQAIVADRLPEVPPPHYLAAEICRPDLLVELEGYCPAGEPA